MAKNRPAELRLPTAPIHVQVRNRESWNEQRRKVQADFFTVGYSGRTVTDFLRSLVEAGVRCLVDIRFNAVSMYKPDFSKANLQRHLATEGLGYLHLPDLGVPRDIRFLAVGKKDRSDIWEWYDSNIAIGFGYRNLHRFFNIAEHPIAFMCTELDPTCCHRHRLALALEKRGLRGLDI